jgi:hypothetical protein
MPTKPSDYNGNKSGLSRAFDWINDTECINPPIMVSDPQTKQGVDATLGPPSVKVFTGGLTTLVNPPWPQTRGKTRNNPQQVTDLSRKTRKNTNRYS